MSKFITKNARNLTFNFTKQKEELYAKFQPII